MKKESQGALGERLLRVGALLDAALAAGELELALALLEERGRLIDVGAAAALSGEDRARVSAAGERSVERLMQQRRKLLDESAKLQATRSYAKR